MNATDNDSNKFIRYRLLKVSNNGKQKFYLDSRSGALEVIVPVSAGEQYSLTVAASDSGGLTSQSVIKVSVRPSPNVRGPVFQQFLYSVSVSEDASKFSTVVSTNAKDPEGEPLKYSIIDGNEQGNFVIGEATGVVRVMKPLNREEFPSYTLVSTNT